MSAYRKARTKVLATVAATCAVLAIAISHEPAVADVSNADEKAAMTVFANIPINEIEDGQYCVGYANVYNGTSPYTFTWSGQFDNSDASTGPLGANQIVSGNISSGRPHYLILHVKDANNEEAADTAFLNIGDDYNWECEA